jgi:hypothetical protein
VILSAAQSARILISAWPIAAIASRNFAGFILYGRTTDRSRARAAAHVHLGPLDDQLPLELGQRREVFWHAFCVP